MSGLGGSALAPVLLARRLRPARRRNKPWGFLDETR